jgi:hypothetical protein
LNLVERLLPSQELPSSQGLRTNLRKTIPSSFLRNFIDHFARTKYFNPLTPVWQ